MARDFLGGIVLPSVRALCLLPKRVRALNEDVERHSKPVLGELEKRRVGRIALPSDELADLLLADAGPPCKSTQPRVVSGQALDRLRECRKVGTARLEPPRRSAFFAGLALSHGDP